VKTLPGEQPHPERVAAYDRLYPLFCEAYDALAPLFDRIAATSLGEVNDDR
jgi:hypothetical protein